MSRQWTAWAVVNHVAQPKFCGHGDTLTEAINSIEYTDGLNSYTIIELVEKCEETGSHLKVVATNGYYEQVFKPEELRSQIVKETT